MIDKTIGIMETFDPELKRAFQIDDEITTDMKEKAYKKKLLTMQKGHLKVSGDMVFYTIQGEGRTMGFPAVFMRLKICNLRCVWSIATGSLVTMSDGIKKPIQKIKTGDLVLSYKDKRFTISKILGVSSYKKKTVKIITEENKTIYVTAEHQFYTNHHKSGTDRSRADKLEGRYLKMSEVSSIEKTKETKDFLIGYLKGALVGDGSVNDSYSGLHMYFQVCDYDFIEKLKEIMDSLGFQSNITISKRETIAGKLVYRLSSSKRKLIESLMEGPHGEEQEKGFIAGFFDAEGYVGKRQLVLSQKDWKTVERVINLLDKYNFDVKVSSVKGAYSMVINRKEEIDRFFKLFPTFIKRKQKSFYDTNRGLKAVKVIKVEESVEKEVYDISTSVGNFFVENYLTANCNAWYTWNPKSKEFWTEGEDWDIQKSVQMIEDVWKCKNKNIIKRLVITGGEPLLQKEAIDELIKAMPNWNIEIETNGTIMPTDYQLKRCQFNCSPKLRNSKNVVASRIKPDVLRALNKANTDFKFVVMSKEDLDEIEKDFLIPFNLDVTRVILMPQGVQPEEIRMNMRNVVEYAKEKGYRVLSRLQVEIWGAKRKV